MHGQDEYDEEYSYYEGVHNKGIISIAPAYFIPTGDFKRKLGKNSLGVEMSFLYQLNLSRYFIGLEGRFHRLDSYTVKDRFVDEDQTTRINHHRYHALFRMYPEIYLSILEFFVEGGAGVNVMHGRTSYYDKVNEEEVEAYSELLKAYPAAYGGVGFHILLGDQVWLTGKGGSNFGTSAEFLARKKTNVIYPESFEAFEFKEATYTAISFSLSLSFIF